MSDDTYTYIGVAHCGCIRVAVVEHDDMDFRALADAQQRGLCVSRVPTPAVRERPWRCHSAGCPYRQSWQQRELLAGL